MAVSDPIRGALNNYNVGETPLATLDATKQQVVAQTKVPTPDVSPVREFINKNFTVQRGDQKPSEKHPEFKQVGQAGISDLQGQVEAKQRAADVWKQQADIMTDATKRSISQTRQTGKAAVAEQERFAAETSSLNAEATQRRADALAHSEKVYNQYVNTIDDLINDREDVSTLQIENAGYAHRLASSQAERAIKEAIGASNVESDPLYRQWQLEESGKFQVAVNNILINADQQTQRLREVMASGAAQIQAGRVQTDAWAFKNEQDAHLANSAARHQSEMQTLAFLDAMRAAELAGMKGFTDFLSSAPISAVEVTPLLSTLLELQLNAEAERKSQGGYSISYNSGTRV